MALPFGKPAEPKKTFTDWANEPSIFDIAGQQTETKTPGTSGNDEWKRPDEPKPVVVTEQTQQQQTNAEPETVYTKEDYEFSARNTVGIIESLTKMAGNGVNYAVMRFRMRKLFKGKSNAEIRRTLEALEDKEAKDKTSLTAEERALLEKGNDIIEKYDLMEKGIPFSQQERNDLEKAICDYQEYTKKPINPKIMIWYTIASILLKRINMAIFN
jgi:predicted extracellular nuclease